MTPISVDKLGKVDIGRQGENLAQEILIDVSSLLGKWPDAVISLLVKRKGDAEPYFADTKVEDNILHWPITAVETAIAGDGKFEIQVVSGVVLAKSVTATFKVNSSLSGSASEELPEVRPSWVDEVLAGVGSSGSTGGIVSETDPTVAEWAKQPAPPTYTAGQVGADPAGSAAAAVAAHSADEDAHPAIWQLISDLEGRLNAIADSDDTTLDQLSEIVTYIKSNKSLIDSITTGKVSTADIVNNLVSTVTNKPLSAAQGKALKALIDAIVVPTKVSAFENDAGYAKQEELAELSEEIDTLKDSVGAGSSGTNAPAYVIAEAERVANAVMEARTAKSLVLLCASDIHTLESNAQSVETTLHLAQGISEICKRVAVDGIAILGDSAFGSSTSTAEETKVAFTYLRENLAKGENEIWIPGNHDHCGISDESSYLSADELYSYIGANTTDKAVTDYDNLYRMYGYVDYDKQRIRLIYLNTSDITDDYAADYGMSNAQGQWLVDTLSAVQEGWGVVVMSHHPLNGSTVTGLLTIFDAYKGKQSGSVTIGDVISYDFTSAKGEFICHLHGHIHNYQVKTLGTYGILSVTIPNGYFWRNNEYGTGGNSDWGDTDAEGNERVFPKTAGTAEDTAFTAIVIDRGSGTVHALKYGAGIDRTAEFANISGGDEPVVIVVEWKDGYRFSSSSGNQSAQTGMTCAYLPMTDMAVGEGYKVTGITFDNAAHANTYCTAYVNDAYTSEYYALTKGQTNIAFATYYTLSIAEDGSYFEIYKTSAPTDGSTLEVGVAGYGSGANAVVTKVSK